MEQPTQQQAPLAVSVSHRDTSTSDEKVYVKVTGLTIPVSDEAIEQLEQLAYEMPFSPWGQRERAHVEFIVFVSLPKGDELSYEEAQRVHLAIFKGLIEKGEKGKWSRLAQYPPARQP